MLSLQSRQFMFKIILNSKNYVKTKNQKGNNSVAIIGNAVNEIYSTLNFKNVSK